VVMLSVACCARAGAPARHSTEETRPATINPQAGKTPRRARLPLAIARCLCFLTPPLTLETATPCRDDCQYCELMVSTATVCNIEPVRVNRNYDCQTFACPDTQETIAKTIYGSASRSKRRRAGGPHIATGWRPDEGQNFLRCAIFCVSLAAITDLG
jgi:hypothetical protein